MNSDSKTVLITGAARRIGAVTAQLFHAAGYRVIIHYNNSAASADKLCEQLNSDRDNSCLLVQGDLNDMAGLAKIAALVERVGRLDVLINNAASDPRIEFESMTVEQWDDLFARNIRAYFIAAQQASPRFPARGGAMINFSSITVHKSPAKMEAYVSTKAATIGLTQSLARELGPRNIRVNTLSPGWVMTDRQLEEFVTPEVKQMLRREQCIAELILPGEIAKVALFLASDMSSAITGQEFLVDRGWACSG